MIKRILTTTAGVALASSLLFGGNAYSYLRTAAGRVGNAAESNVPIDFQIERARQMVADLAPEVRNSMHVIAKEEIALEALDHQIAAEQERAEKSKREILRLQSDLADGRTTFRYAGHSYGRQEVTEDLSRRFTRFKVGDETLEHLKSMRDARARNLDAARQKLSAMVSAQKKLQTDVANLEAKRKLVEVAQASSDVVFDDSQLARAKDLIADIRTKLDVAAKLASADVDAHGEIPLEAEAEGDVEAQVAAYFELPASRAEVAARTASLPQE